MDLRDMYLILHKVRGEPAFDIAYKMCRGRCGNPECGLIQGDSCKAADEGWYTIPTSGHSAYPIMSWPLEELTDTSDFPHNRPADMIAYDKVTQDMLDSVIDHYQFHEEKPTLKSSAKIAVGAILKTLGFKEGKAMPRRKLG